jgi:scyllo-inositol 2-dehydrogenase (NADP+)
MVRRALTKNLHVFCEKPFCLDIEDGRELAALAKAKGLVTQVGYHYRFLGTFIEAKRLITSGLIGKIHHIRVEAYGPVVLRPKGMTWRSRKAEGGGCLYDYACHAIDLVHFVHSTPISVEGTILNKIFSSDVEDEVYTTLRFPDGSTAQVAANWSDESFRKMSMQMTVWGRNGRMRIDRQEIQIYLGGAQTSSNGLQRGWNIYYTTELSETVWFYLRGEEYSMQIDHFARCIKDRRLPSVSSFETALQTDIVISKMIRDADNDPAVSEDMRPIRPKPRSLLSWDVANSLKHLFRRVGTY